jgi:ESS family glutamate:Na+ symporter
VLRWIFLCFAAKASKDHAVEIDLVEGLRTLKLDLIMTLALAAVALLGGSTLQRKIGIFSRSNIPAAAIGGLLFAFCVLMLRLGAGMGIALDTSLRAPLQTAFFTTIGLGATLSLLRAGGARLVFFWFLASMTAVVQNLVGIGVASALDAPLALGIICGALTLTGGPATGLAFASIFEGKGVEGASSLIIASATFGIFLSSLVGNPVATWLIRRYKLAPRETIADAGDDLGAPASTLSESPPPEVASAPLDAPILLRHVGIILTIMGLGAILSFGLTYLSETLPPAIGPLFRLPGYIGAMIIAALARNLNERYRWIEIDSRAVNTLGTMALAIFLVIALMDLKLWQLAGLAIPMLIILAVQVVVMIGYAALVTFNAMGRDYEAAVTVSGHIGFGLGITPNAVANMEALTQHYGPAPRSFLVVPVVGAFFIDFSNSIIITIFANLLG